MSASTWSRLKPHQQRLDKDALPTLLRDLHALNATNRTFLAARFLATTPDELTALHRRIVHDTAHLGWAFPMN